MGFLGAGEHLGAHPESGHHPVEEVRPVGRIASGGSSGKANGCYPCLLAHPRVNFYLLEGALERFGSEVPGGIHALAQVNNFHVASDIAQGTTVYAWNIGNEETDGIGAAVNTGDPPGGQDRRSGSGGRGGI